MTAKIIFSGFGGQGIMAMGQLITYAGMFEGKEVSWLPSYGPEMRGGAANCSVIVSDEPIGAPNISSATDVVVMNEPSMEKFEDYVVPGGNLFVNSSLIAAKASRKDIHVFRIPVNDIAKKTGNDKVANMVMLGAFLKVNPVVTRKSVVDAFLKVYGENKKSLLPLNLKALDAGEEAVK